MNVYKRYTTIHKIKENVFLFLQFNKNEKSMVAVVVVVVVVWENQTEGFGLNWSLLTKR